jgi:hypothetical protein
MLYNVQAGYHIHHQLNVENNVNNIEQNYKKRKIFI